MILNYDIVGLVACSHSGRDEQYFIAFSRTNGHYMFYRSSCISDMDEYCEISSYMGTTRAHVGKKAYSHIDKIRYK